MSIYRELSRDYTVVYEAACQHTIEPTTSSQTNNQVYKNEEPQYGANNRVYGFGSSASAEASFIKP